MRYWPLTAVLLAFWLGRETGAEPGEQNQIILRDGEWRTEIRPGQIDLRGPRDTRLRVRVGEDTAGGLVVEPQVLLIGPRLESKTQSHVDIAANSVEARVEARSPHTRRTDIVENPDEVDRRMRTVFMCADERSGARLEVLNPDQKARVPKSK